MRDDRVMELDIDCIEHSKYAYEEEEAEQMFWNGELTDIPPIDDAEFIIGDYFDFCEDCKKWILQ